MRRGRAVVGMAAAVLAAGFGPARADLSISNRTFSELVVDVYNNGDSLMAVACRTLRIRGGDTWAVNVDNSINCLVYSQLKVKVWAEVGSGYARAQPCFGYNLDWKGSAGVSITGSDDGQTLTCTSY
jgi:hypothetical protein